MVVGYRVGLACSAYPTVVGGPGVHRAYERWTRCARQVGRRDGDRHHDRHEHRRDAIGETLNPYGTKDPGHLRYHDDNRALGRLPGQLRLRVRYLQLATAWMEYLLCTPEELESILAPTPWALTDTYAAESTEPGGPWPPGQWTAVLRLHG